MTPGNSRLSMREMDATQTRPIQMSTVPNELERDHGAGYETPLDALPSLIDGVEQRGHALEEQHDRDP